LAAKGKPAAAASSGRGGGGGGKKKGKNDIGDLDDLLAAGLNVGKKKGKK